MSRSVAAEQHFEVARKWRVAITDFQGDGTSARYQKAVPLDERFARHEEVPK